MLSGKTGLSTTNSSSVGLSGKFEELESPSPVSEQDLMNILFSQDLMNILFSSIFSRFKSYPYDSGNQKFDFLKFLLHFQSFHIEFSQVERIPISFPSGL